MRLRSPEEIKKRVTGDIKKLNHRLLLLSLKLVNSTAQHPFFVSPPGKIVFALFRKAVNTFKAIQILKKEGLIEESWILLRVLLEGHVNILYFLKNDGVKMTMRYLDTTILDKLKLLREANFFEGTPQALDRNAWEHTESDIKARYTQPEINGMRRNGFTGMAFDQRADAVGLKTMYDFCYRIASRSIHTFDPAETIFEFGGNQKEKRAFLRIRRLQLESNQNMLLGRLAYLVSEATGSYLTLELILIGLGYEKFRDKTPGLERFPQEPVSEKTSDASFYVWRE